jgi:hypothetical protein
MMTTPMPMLHLRPSCSPKNAVNRDPKKAPTNGCQGAFLGEGFSGLPSRIATMRPKMVAPGVLKVSLNAVPSTDELGLV